MLKGYAGSCATTTKECAPGNGLCFSAVSLKIFI